jgi:hypothetical protein
MSDTLHSIRKLSETAYELDIEWGPEGARGWYRFDLDDGIIVPRMPAAFNHLHGWLLRPLLNTFGTYINGGRVDFPVALLPPR